MYLIKFPVPTPRPPRCIKQTPVIRVGGTGRRQMWRSVVVIRTGVDRELTTDRRDAHKRGIISLVMAVTAQ